MSKGRRKASISDVANHLGVSKSTVSRALNDYQDISKSTRQRIQHAAESLGYRPSSHARKLKRARAETIGFVTSIKDSRASDPFLATFLDSLSRTLEIENHDLLLANALDPEHSVEVFERLLTEHKVDGFIVARTEVTDPRIQYLLEHNIPFVAHGRTAEHNDYAWWDTDNEQVFIEAVQHVVSLGHQRVGLLGGMAHLNYAFQRRQGYRVGLQQCGIEFDPLLECEVEPEESAGMDATFEMMSQRNPPTALLATTDSVAIGAIAAIHSLGLQVGTDVSVIGYDGISVGAYIDPSLTTYSQSIRESGSQVATMMMEVINGAEPGSLQHLESAVLIRRNSDGPPTVSSAELAKKIVMTQQPERRISYV